MGEPRVARMLLHRLSSLPRRSRSALARLAGSDAARATEVARAIAAHPGRRLAVVEGRRVVVHDVAAVEPWRWSAELAGRVQAVLERLGVDHWSVQPRHARVTQWAVRADDLPSVLTGLATELAGEGYYLRAGGPPVLLEESAADARSVDLARFVCDADGRVHTDYELCQLYAWTPSDRGTLLAPERAGLSQELDDEHPIATVTVPNAMGTLQPRPAALATPDSTEVDFPVDVVYMWVNDSDPAWRARRDAAHVAGGVTVPNSADEVAAYRFRDRGELRASLRSLEMYAPWVRRVFLVTDRQRPDWLDPYSSRVVVVDHTEIIPGDALPTFSSHVIGSQLHRIPGLAAHYLVVNDDILFSRPVSPLEFFTPEGALKVVFSRSRRPAVVSTALTPLEQARANSAGLIERTHGRRVTSLFAHVPIPQSLDVAREVAERFAPEIAVTLSHPFRDAGDYEVNSWLHLYHALFTGRAVAARVRFAYFNVGEASARAKMDNPASFARAMFVCVNDSGSGTDDGVSDWLAGWLQRTYPVPGAHELVAGSPAGSALRLGGDRRTQDGADR